MAIPLSVEVLGREYTLRVDEENAERTRAVAERVDRRMRAFQHKHPQQAKLTTTIITALALAEDLRAERAARVEQAEHLDDDLRALTALLGDALNDAPGETDLDDRAPPSPGVSPEDASSR